MQVFFILFSVHFAVYQYINSKCLYRTHVTYLHKQLYTIDVCLCIFIFLLQTLCKGIAVY